MGRARKDVASSLFLYFVFQDFALSILLRSSELLRLVLDKMSFCLSKAVVTHTSIRTKERKKNGRRVRHFWFCGFVLGGKETKILSRPQVETGRKKLKKNVYLSNETRHSDWNRWRQSSDPLWRINQHGKKRAQKKTTKEKLLAILFNYLLLKLRPRANLSILRVAYHLVFSSCPLYCLIFAWKQRTCRQDTQWNARLRDVSAQNWADMAVISRSLQSITVSAIIQLHFPVYW